MIQTETVKQSKDKQLRIRWKTKRICNIFSSLYSPIGNIFNHYRDKGQYVTGDSKDQGNPDIDILAEMRTTFTLLLAIFFPSCTGEWWVISDIHTAKDCLCERLGAMEHAALCQAANWPCALAIWGSGRWVSTLNSQLIAGAIGLLVTVCWCCFKFHFVSHMQSYQIILRSVHPYIATNFI